MLSSLWWRTSFSRATKPSRGHRVRASGGESIKASVYTCLHMNPHFSNYYYTILKMPVTQNKDSQHTFNLKQPIMKRVFQKAAWQQRGFQSRATETSTCISSCLTLNKIWGWWDPPASTAHAATAMPCSRSRTWKVFWKITSTNSAMLTWWNLRINSKRDDWFQFSAFFYLKTAKLFSFSYFPTDDS